MASLQHRRRPWTPASTRPRHCLSVLPTPPSSGASQRPQLQRQAPPTPAPASEQLPHAPSPPPLHRQSSPQTAVPNTPRIPCEESPDAAPLSHGQQFCSCYRQRPDQTGQTDETDEMPGQTEQEATDGSSTCAVHSTQGSGSQTSSLGSQGSKNGSQHKRPSRESDSLSKMDSQREFFFTPTYMNAIADNLVRDAREYIERRRQYQ